jgi:glycosyltransferase involved in cell wall biosynthesis
MVGAIPSRHRPGLPSAVKDPLSKSARDIHGTILYQGRPLRVCVVGSDDSGWALDTEARIARKNLAKLLEVTDTVDGADVLHSVWPENTAVRWPVMSGQLPVPIVLSFSNAPFKQAEHPPMLSLMRLAPALVAQSSQALAELRAMAFDASFLVPYPFDNDGYVRLPRDEERLEQLRRELDFPSNAYVVGNFFRDTEGANLANPKRQKGADIFLAMLKEAAGTIGTKKLVALIAGPRRHWLRRRLTEEGLAFRFYGKVTDDDDYPQGILPKSTLNLLYQLCDVQVIPSRWEGAPRSFFECALTGTPVISTRVGIAEDVLPGSLLFDDAVAGARLLIDDAQHGTVRVMFPAFEAKLNQFSSEERVLGALRAVYEHVAAKLGGATELRRSARSVMYPEYLGRGTAARLRRVYRFAVRKVSRALARTRERQVIVLWNSFMPPPYGGANQFLLALEKAFARRGITVLRNDWRVAPSAHIFNAMWFDHSKVSELRAAQPRAIFIHRVDGPISRYRGTAPEESDDTVFALNRHMDFTAFQSIYSLTQSIEMGYDPARPLVVRNSVDADIFNSSGRVPYDGKRRLRLVSTSWSGNVRKGRDTYTWLDGHLDFAKVEYRFVGRCEADLRNIRLVPPVPSAEVAAHLGWADAFIGASAHEPASNSVSEALACGLPVIYLDSGGTREIVGMGGCGYKDREEIPSLIERIGAHHEAYMRSITVPTMDEIVDGYLGILAAAERGR